MLCRNGPHAMPAAKRPGSRRCHCSNNFYLAHPASMLFVRCGWLSNKMHGSCIVSVRWSHRRNHSTIASSHRVLMCISPFMCDPSGKFHTPTCMLLLCLLCVSYSCTKLLNSQRTSFTWYVGAKAIISIAIADTLIIMCLFICTATDFGNLKPQQQSRWFGGH